MDLLAILEEKKFLAREFLLWLWFMVDTGKEVFYVPNLGNVTVALDGRLVLESGQGDNIERIACRGEHIHLKEARTALKEGKMAEEAGLLITIGENEYRLYLKATPFYIQSLRTPKIEQNTVDRDEGEGKYYEKLFLLEEINHAIDELFAIFLKHRLNIKEWNRLAKDIGDWIARG